MKRSSWGPIVGIPLCLGLIAQLIPIPSYACPSRPVPSATKERTIEPPTCIAPPALLDTVVIPGERVGPVTRTTTYLQLKQNIGQRFLTNQTLSGQEGEGEWLATTVALDQSHSFTIVWTDKTRTKPHFIRIQGNAWKTPEGIGVGMSFNDLRQKAGEFRLTGLAWDNGGALFLENTRLAHYRHKLLLTVDATPGANKKFPNNYRAVLGDTIFSSSNPHWQPLGMKVVQMTVVLNP